MKFWYALEFIQVFLVLLAYRKQLTRIVAQTYVSFVFRALDQEVAHTMHELLEKGSKRRIDRETNKLNSSQEQIIGNDNNTSWVADLFDEYPVSKGGVNTGFTNGPSHLREEGAQTKASWDSPIFYEYQSFCREITRGNANELNQLSIGLPNSNSFAQQVKQLIEDYSVFCVSIIWMFCNARDARIST